MRKSRRFNLRTGQNDKFRYIWVNLTTTNEKENNILLRNFNFEPSFKLRWCRARDLFRSQILMTTGGLKLQISCIRSSYLTHRKNKNEQKK